jgi:hypothetical protein
MLRITAVSIGFLVQVAVAHAAECVPILEGALLCEQDGSFFVTDPSSGETVDVTEALVATRLGGDLSDVGTSDAAPAPLEPPAGESAYFEDRLTELCAGGDCPAGLTGAIDSLNGYIPSYQ